MSLDRLRALMARQAGQVAAVERTAAEIDAEMAALVDAGLTAAEIAREVELLDRRRVSNRIARHRARRPPAA